VDTTYLKIYNIETSGSLSPAEKVEIDKVEKDVVRVVRENEKNGKTRHG
jgi:hypothetical protein